MNKIEVLSFYDKLTDDQKQSFMMLMDTLEVLCEKRSREGNISVRGSMLQCDCIDAITYSVVGKAIKQRVMYHTTAMLFYTVAE